MNNKPTKLRETSGYDELKTQAIDRFRSQDPMTLSNSELRSAIDYMLAYRWALEGDEDVLHEYIEASKIRNEDRHPSQNDFPPIDKFHPDWWYYRQEMEEPVEIDDNYKNESRHMNKKLIRLTESDLHQIIKESVNKVLTELDWKTYANAARKRYDNAYADNSGRATNQQELEKGNQLSQAANNAFQKQHGGTTINRASQPQQAGYYDPARNDYQNYMNGKSKYVQGQGWE